MTAVIVTVPLNVMNVIAVTATVATDAIAAEDVTVTAVAEHDKRLNHEVVP